MAMQQITNPIPIGDGKRQVASILADIQEEVEQRANGDQTATLRLLKSLDEMRMAVEPPHLRLTRIRFEPLQNMCQLMAIEMGLLEAVTKRKGQSITAGTLSKELGRPESLIVRIMRLLTVNGVCDEVSAQTYCSNELADFLNTPGQIGALKNCVELMFPIAGKLTASIRETSFEQFSDGEKRSPFHYTYGMSLFDLLKENPEQKTAFDDYMAGRRQGLRKKWFETFPIDRLSTESTQKPDLVLVVDVAGGSGHDVEDFRRSNLQIPGRCILEDLPETLAQIKTPLKDVEQIPYNFFTEQPIKGAKVYFFRAIFHDWSDETSLKILANTVAAMDKESLLLIEDWVLPDIKASWRSASMDIMMMMMPGGIERTQSMWERLLEAAGLELVKVWGTAETERVIETRRK